MAALRTWSAPGRRAELIAAAWDAGETTVSALAEAARVSRPTVYADLRSAGIDPDHRPKKGNNLTTAIAVEGIDGTSPEDVRQHLLAFERQHPERTGDDVAAASARSYSIYCAVHRYNRLRPLLDDMEQARRARDRALHLVEKRWEELSTAAHWMAAHHAYVVAVDEARAAIDAWRDRVRPAAEMGWFQTDAELDVYEQRILAEEGAPALPEIPPDAEDTAQAMREKLDRTHERRTSLARETLPAGSQA
ncbi:hypothetical protein GCM10009802_08180 [Streptomyces synnematoformans]|uniref:Uncharacterized protein n=2 Tax=Streptomyces synnematoformans TaxID=415721 RepID=A0ABN2XFJ1_9ACTN